MATDEERDRVIAELYAQDALMTEAEVLEAQEEYHRMLTSEPCPECRRPIPYGGYAKGRGWCFKCGCAFTTVYKDGNWILTPVPNFTDEQRAALLKLSRQRSRQ